LKPQALLQCMAVQEPLRQGKIVKKRNILVAIGAVPLLLAAASLSHAHHSFAMYDQEQVKTLTGRLTRYIPGANHAQLLFELLDEEGNTVLGEDGKPQLWGAETGPAARIAREGVTPDNFPAGTIISLQLNPLRNGKPFGAMPNGSPLIHCGTTLPAGGCNAETGKVYLSANN
jgi:hypothetical protein